MNYFTRNAISPSRSAVTTLCTRRCGLGRGRPALRRLRAKHPCGDARIGP